MESGENLIQHKITNYIWQWLKEAESGEIKRKNKKRFWQWITNNVEVKLNLAFFQTEPGHYVLELKGQF